MGRFGAILGAYWSVLDAVKTKANMLNMYVVPRDWDDVCVLGPSLGVLFEPSWGVLGASWLGVLERSWAVLGPCWTLLGTY